TAPVLPPHLAVLAIFTGLLSSGPARSTFVASAAISAGAAGGGSASPAAPGTGRKIAKSALVAPFPPASPALTPPAPPGAESSPSKAAPPAPPAAWTGAGARTRPDTDKPAASASAVKDTERRSRPFLVNVVISNLCPLVRLEDVAFNSVRNP